MISNNTMVSSSPSDIQLGLLILILSSSNACVPVCNCLQCVNFVHVLSCRLKHLVGLFWSDLGGRVMEAEG